MSVNLFTRLRNLLPPAPLQVGTVTDVGADGYSTVLLLPPGGQTQVAPGLSRGSVLRARGDTFPSGTRVFVRNGVIETKAPDGDPIEVEIGRRVAAPLGPGVPVSQSLLLGSAIILTPPAYRAKPYTGSVLSAFSGGLRPLSVVIAAGAPPAGITMSALGDLSGTPSTNTTALWNVLATDTAGATATASVSLAVVG